MQRPLLPFATFRGDAAIQFGVKRKFYDPSAVFGAYPGQIFTAPYVLSIRYLARLHDTAMRYLRFCHKNT